MKFRSPHCTVLGQWWELSLVEIFPEISVSNCNAEQIDDLLDRRLSPNVVVMNPPFSASPLVDKRNPFAILKHIKSALSRLQPSGRLVTITANWFNPQGVTT